MLQAHIPHTWVSQGLGRLMPTAWNKDLGSDFGYFRLGGSQQSAKSGWS